MTTWDELMARKQAEVDAKRAADPRHQRRLELVKRMHDGEITHEQALNAAARSGKKGKR